MFTYKNTSLTVKTFYGVEFKPGDVHEVSGYINDPAMIRVSAKPKIASKVVKAESPQADTSAAENTSKSKESKDLKETTKSNKQEQGGESDGTDNNK